MNYSIQTEILLEFDKLLQEVCKYFKSEYGKHFFLDNIASKPLSKNDIEKQYKQIDEYDFLFTQFPDFPIYAINDLSEYLTKIHIENYFIDELGILLLRNNVMNVRDIKSFFKITTYQKELPQLIHFNNSIFYDSAILREIDKIVDEDGKVKSNASKTLMSIRIQISSCQSQINQSFNAALQRAKQAGVLNEIQESIRNGRRVLAVNSAYKKTIKGMIVDESDTGSIAYIEPSETIQLNNEWSEYQREEQREVRRILIELTHTLSKYSQLIEQYQDFMAEWDTLQARVKFMKTIEGSIPKIGKKLDMHKAFHPLLKIKNKQEKKQTIPFTMTMSQSHQMLMISGPNAGGKSITLKAIGLAALMTKHALPIAAQADTTIPIFSHIIGDMGDQQSIDDELSTYSSKLQLWKKMIEQSSENTLLLFDELGDGTDPSFGAAMAIAVLEQVLEKRATIIATTHYSDIKKFAQQRGDTLNANMMFDEKKLEPMYQLSIGLAGSSYTFHIARKMGLSPSLIARAESLTKQEQLNYDKKLFQVEKKEKELQRQKQELEKSDKEVKRQMKDWNRLHLDLDLLRKKIKYEKMLALQEQVNAKERELNLFKEELKKKQKAEDLLAEQKRIEAEKKEAEQHSKNLYKQIHNIDPNQVLNIGDRVQFIQTQAIGIIDKLSKKKATVIFDNIKSTISIEELILLPPEEDKKTNTTKKIISLDRNTPRELDLRGKYVYEAIPELEDFINKALLNNLHQIKIIHGKGKLKSEILKTIQQFKSITSYSHALPEQGGDGVTYISF